MDLVFDSPVQSTTNNHSLGRYYSGFTYDFTNIAPTSGSIIDARISISSVSDGYIYNGTFPNYSSASGEPSGDLGYLYTYTESNTEPGSNETIGGITYNISFYEAGSNFTTPFIIPNFRLLIYDVDGESNQSESVRAFASDGFYAYQIPTNDMITVDIENGGESYLFTGPGINVAENDASGAFIFHYRDTSSIDLQMVSASTGTLNNGVFSAIDGDLSLIGKNTDAFTDPQPIPEPSSILFTALAATGLLLRRNRRA